MHQRTYDRLLERLWDCEERRDIDVAGSSNGGDSAPKPSGRPAISRLRPDSPYEETLPRSASAQPAWLLGSLEHTGDAAHTF